MLKKPSTDNLKFHANKLTSVHFHCYPLPFSSLSESLLSKNLTPLPSALISFLFLCISSSFFLFIDPHQVVEPQEPLIQDGMETCPMEAVLVQASTAP